MRHRSRGRIQAIQVPVKWAIVTRHHPLAQRQPCSCAGPFRRTTRLAPETHNRFAFRLQLVYVSVLRKARAAVAKRFSKDKHLDSAKHSLEFHWLILLVLHICAIEPSLHYSAYLSDVARHLCVVLHTVRKCLPDIVWKPELGGVTDFRLLDEKAEDPFRRQ